MSAVGVRSVSPLNVIVGVTVRQVRKFAKTGHFVPPLLIPALFLGALAGGLSAVAETPAFDYEGNYTGFVFIFVLMQGAAFAAIFSSITFAEDMEGGFMSRMMLASPNHFGIVLGIALAALIECVFIIAVLFGIGVAAGMQTGGSIPQILLIVVLALGLNLAVSFFGAGVALRLRSIQAAPIMMLPVFMVLFVAPVYVTRQLLDGWLAVAADYNPLTPLMEASRGLLIGKPVSIGIALASVAALNVVFIGYALLGMRKAKRTV